MTLTLQGAIELTKKYGMGGNEKQASYDSWKNAACLLAAEVARLKVDLADCVRAADEMAKASDAAKNDVTMLWDMIAAAVGGRKREAPSEAALTAHLLEQGYSSLRKVEGVGMCGIMRMMFTVGVFIGLDYTGMQGRFCFDNLLTAQSFLESWDGKAFPVVGVDGCTAIKWDGRIL